MRGVAVAAAVLALLSHNTGATSSTPGGMGNTGAQDPMQTTKDAADAAQAAANGMPGVQDPMADPTKMAKDAADAAAQAAGTTTQAADAAAKAAGTTTQAADAAAKAAADAAANAAKDAADAQKAASDAINDAVKDATKGMDDAMKDATKDAMRPPIEPIPSGMPAGLKWDDKASLAKVMKVRRSWPVRGLIDLPIAADVEDFKRFKAALKQDVQKSLKKLVDAGQMPEAALKCYEDVKTEVVARFGMGECTVPGDCQVKDLLEAGFDVMDAPKWDASFKVFNEVMDKMRLPKALAFVTEAEDEFEKMFKGAQKDIEDFRKRSEEQIQGVGDMTKDLVKRAEKMQKQAMAFYNQVDLPAVQERLAKFKLVGECGLDKLKGALMQARMGQAVDFCDKEAEAGTTCGEAIESFLAREQMEKAACFDKESGDQCDGPLTLMETGGSLETFDALLDARSFLCKKTACTVQGKKKSVMDVYNDLLPLATDAALGSKKEAVKTACECAADVFDALSQKTETQRARKMPFTTSADMTTSLNFLKGMCARDLTTGDVCGAVEGFVNVMRGTQDAAGADSCSGCRGIWSMVKSGAAGAQDAELKCIKDTASGTPCMDIVANLPKVGLESAMEAMKLGKRCGPEKLLKAKWEGGQVEEDCKTAYKALKGAGCCAKYLFTSALGEGIMQGEVADAIEFATNERFMPEGCAAPAGEKEEVSVDFTCDPVAMLENAKEMGDAFSKGFGQLAGDFAAVDPAGVAIVPVGKRTCRVKAAVDKRLSKAMDQMTRNKLRLPGVAKLAKTYGKAFDFDFKTMDKPVRMPEAWGKKVVRNEQKIQEKKTELEGLIGKKLDFVKKMAEEPKADAFKEWRKNRDQITAAVTDLVKEGEDLGDYVAEFEATHKAYSADEVKKTAEEMGLKNVRAMLGEEFDIQTEKVMTRLTAAEDDGTGLFDGEAGRAFRAAARTYKKKKAATSALIRKYGKPSQRFTEDADIKDDPRKACMFIIASDKEAEQLGKDKRVKKMLQSQEMFYKSIDHRVLCAPESERLRKVVMKCRVGMTMGTEDADMKQHSIAAMCAKSKEEPQKTCGAVMDDAQKLLTKSKCYFAASEWKEDPTHGSVLDIAEECKQSACGFAQKMGSCFHELTDCHVRGMNDDREKALAGVEKTFDKVLSCPLAKKPVFDKEKAKETILRIKKLACKQDMTDTLKMALGDDIKEAFALQASEIDSKAIRCRSKTASRSFRGLRDEDTDVVVPAVSELDVDGDAEFVGTTSVLDKGDLDVDNVPPMVPQPPPPAKDDDDKSVPVFLPIILGAVGGLGLLGMSALFLNRKNSAAPKFGGDQAQEGELTTGFQKQGEDMKL